MTIETTNQVKLSARPSLLTLFLMFLRLGATAFGGPAIVPYIRRFIVDRERWVDDRSFREGLVLSQALPGVTGMQVASYVGLRVAGLWGAAVACVGFVLPAALMMIVLTALYAQAHGLPLVTAAFVGLRVVIVAIVAHAALLYGRGSVREWKDAIVVIVGAAAFALGVNTVLVVALAALLGLVLFRAQTAAPNESPGEAKPYPLRPLLIMLVATGIGLAIVYVRNAGLFDLSILMMRVSIFAFGGGMSVLPLMYDAVVQSGNLIAGRTFLDGIALGQITPGPVVNTATFVGFLLYGLSGALVATVAVYLPSFLILVGVEPHYNRLRGSRHFQTVVRAVAVSFVGLLLTMAARFALDVSWGWPHALLAGAVFVALFKVDVIWVVLAAIVVSMFLF